jgi:hypothetical protein
MKDKFLVHMSNDELILKLAEELVQMHVQTGIDLNHWPTAMELVRRFYIVEQTLVVKGRRSDLAKKKLPTSSQHEPIRREHENQKSHKRSCSPYCQD